MKNDFQSLVNIHRRELLNLWKESVDIFALLKPLLNEHVEDIVTGFYQQLMKRPQVAAFLNTELINQRLKRGVTAWLTFTFYGAHTQTDEEFLQYQARLGRLHADIDIPLNLFLMGLRILKGEIVKYVLTLEKESQQPALLYVDRLLDLVLAIAAESYNEGHGEILSDLQRMRMSIPPENLQLVCEQMRNRLLMWFTAQLSILHRDVFHSSEGQTLTPLRDSEIGMWLEHKATLLFPENETLDRLGRLCKEIDELLVLARQTEQQAYVQTLSLLEEKVKKADWLLSELGREVSEMEGRTDPLTHLFNRRHLNTVMNFQSRKVRSTQGQFAVILLDIDHFKPVNDRFGHDAGDLILKNISDLLVENVRCSDFVFRYGGEEFLVLLPSVQETTAWTVAEKLRKTVENTSFSLPDGSELKLTISCGIALNGGELNYERTIKRADQALYRAKREGRNRCVIAPLPQVGVNA